MSGPKYSQIDLEKERERQLERERQRRIEEEKRKLTLHREITKAETLLQRATEKLSRFGEEACKKAAELSLQKSLPLLQFHEQKHNELSKINQLPTHWDETNIQSMEHYLKRINELINRWEQEMSGSLLMKLEILENEVKLEKQHKQQTELMTKSKSLQVGEKRLFTVPLQEEVTITEIINLDNMLEEVKEELHPYLERKQLPFYREVQQLQESIISIFQNDTFDTAYKKSQIEMRMKAFYTLQPRYDEQLKQLQERLKEYENHLLTYESLCNVLHIEADPMFTYKEEQEFSIQYKRLVEEIKSCQNLWEEKQRAAYISDSVNEVMASLGYDVLAKDYMLRAQQGIHHQIFELGLNKGVNVFVSNNGSILFEVSGISTEDKELTNTEKLEVKEAMEDFCEDYEEIKEKLREKGIVLSRESLSPADEKYAKNINISKKTVIKETANTRKKRSETNIRRKK